MTEIQAKDLKRIESLLNENAALEVEKQELAENKETFSVDEYKKLIAENRERTKEIKTEITAFKKNCSKNLELVQTQLESLEREEKGLGAELKEVESGLKSDSADKKELTVEKKTIQERLKAIAKESAQQKKMEALLIKGTDIVSRKSPAVITKDRKGPEEEETASAKKEGINPLYAAGAFVALIIIVAIIVQTTFFRKDIPESVVESEVTEEDTALAIEDNSNVLMDAQGVITGKNVNLRQQPNIMSAVIKQLQNGDAVKVTEKQIVNESGDAVLSRMTQLTTDTGEKIKLDSGKGIVILEEKGDLVVVSYAIDDGKSVTGTVEKDAVTQISGDIWYLVINADGIEGWVYGKYVEVK